jgi:hypothetical protein
MWKANMFLTARHGTIGVRRRTGEDGQRETPVDRKRASNGQ